MRIGSLFSGYGGLEMGVQSVLGGTTAWVSDIDPGACKILAHRYPDVPNLGDITRIDWASVEPVDVLTGGFPCQDLSKAGKRAGLRPGTRSGLWNYMADAIAVMRPRLVVAENVRGLLKQGAHSDVEPCPWCMGERRDGAPVLRALGAVLGDLADLGYDARWVGLPASDIGAPHERFRVFVVAAPAGYSDVTRLEGRPSIRRLGQSAPWAPGVGAAADAGGERHGGREDSGAVGRVDGPDAGEAWERERARGVAGDRGTEALSAAGPDAAGSGGLGRALVSWGAYEPAIRRWESALGRNAPAPTEPWKDSGRLSPAFVEWMMGLPAGHVTDVPGITRNEALKALGNGVVPQQAAAALRTALDVRAVAA